mgnify:CR=1 FL=1
MDMHDIDEPLRLWRAANDVAVVTQGSRPVAALVGELAPTGTGPVSGVA